LRDLVVSNPGKKTVSNITFDKVKRVASWAHREEEDGFHGAMKKLVDTPTLLLVFHHTVMRRVTPAPT
jgi:hypothetical protein